jgi:isopenicillin-N epimerase
MTAVARDLPPDEDSAWASIRELWDIPPGLTYLNHGGYGYAPRAVLEAKARYFAEISANPMGVFCHELEDRLLPVRDRVADLVGASRSDLVLVENATYGVNVVATSLKLKPGDEVVLTEHTYGAVSNIWQRACLESGATLVTAEMPWPVEGDDQLVDAITDAINDRTRLLVFSHITSGSAMRLPVEGICGEARARGVLTCIDAPHAPAVVDLDMRALGCDFYAASCHKWLCGPVGTGFLYVRPEHQSTIVPPVMSWGRLKPAKPQAWQDWFTWIGTRDLSGIFSLPVSIDLLAEIGWDNFRRRSHYLVQSARQRIEELTGMPAMVPGHPTFDPATFVPMIAMPIPTPVEEAYALRSRLHAEHKIEVPVYTIDEQTYLRVSAHVYNTLAELERLVEVLRVEFTRAWSRRTAG